MENAPPDGSGAATGAGFADAFGAGLAAGFGSGVRPKSRLRAYSPSGLVLALGFAVFFRAVLWRTVILNRNCAYGGRAYDIDVCFKSSKSTAPPMAGA